MKSIFNQEDINKYNGSGIGWNDRLTDFYFEEVTPQVLTGAGLDLLRQDPYLSQDTMRRLVATESVFLDFEMFRDILIEQDIDKLFYEHFMFADGMGELFLSMCIRDDLMQTYGELVARYSEQRNLPFIVGMRLLNIYRARRTLRYKPDSSIYMAYREWEPSTTKAPSVKPRAKKK